MPTYEAIVEESGKVQLPDALARKIAGKSSHVVRLGKQAFYRQLEMSLDEAYHYTAEVMVENMLDSEAEEGIGAFLDKRKPRWPS